MSEYNIFLSHSEADGDLIEQIAHGLDCLDISTYVEENEDNYGVDQVKSICEAIEESENILIVLTENSINSQWVNQEIGYAFALEKNILPVRVGRPNVSGMISNLKGIRSTTDSIDEIINVILQYFINENGIEYFNVDCEKCGENEEWEIPERKDAYNWEKEKKPMICKCDECNHQNQINPYTLNYV